MFSKLRIAFLSFNIYHFFLLISYLYFCISAGAPDTLWTRTYGGSGKDVGHSVLQTSDGGFIVVGETNSFGAGSNDVYIIRTNPNGDTLWTKTYGGISYDYGKSVKHTSDGGLIIAGSADSYDAGRDDVFLIRTKANGDTLWTKTYGDNLPNYGNSVQQTSDDGFIIAGTRGSPPYDFEDFYVIRTNSSGDTLWTRTYNNNISDVCNSVQQTSDGGYVFLGTTGLVDIWFIRTTSSGDTLWTRTYGGTGEEAGFSVLQARDGGFVITGYTTSFGAGTYDVYLIRTNENGDTLWTKTYGGEHFDYGISIEKTRDDGFIITGGYSDGVHSDDVYIIRTNSQGDTLWTKTVGGIHYDIGRSIYQTTDGGFIIVGSTQSFGAGNEDVYLIRLDKETVEIQDENPEFFLKPNNLIVSSSQGNISIRYTITYSTSVKLEAFDIQGRLVKVIEDRFMHKGSYSIKCDSERFGSGVYYVKLSVGENCLIRKAVIVR